MDSGPACEEVVNESHTRFLPERADRRHVWAGVRAAEWNTRQLCARRFGDSIFTDNRDLPVGAGGWRLALAVCRAGTGAPLRRGRAGGGIARGGIGPVVVPQLCAAELFSCDPLFGGIRHWSAGRAGAAAADEDLEGQCRLQGPGLADPDL